MCFLDVCITNAFILGKLCTRPEPTTRDEGRLKAFRAQLAKALIGEYNSRQRAGRHSSKGAQQPSPPHITFHSPHHPRTAHVETDMMVAVGVL